MISPYTTFDNSSPSLRFRPLDAAAGPGDGGLGHRIGHGISLGPCRRLRRGLSFHHRPDRLRVRRDRLSVAGFRKPPASWGGDGVGDSGHLAYPGNRPFLRKTAGRRDGPEDGFRSAYRASTGRLCRFRRRCRPLVRISRIHRRHQVADPWPLGRRLGGRAVGGARRLLLAHGRARRRLLVGTDPASAWAPSRRWPRRGSQNAATCRAWKRLSAFTPSPSSPR